MSINSFSSLEDIKANITGDIEFEWTCISCDKKQLVILTGLDLIYGKEIVCQNSSDHIKFYIELSILTGWYQSD